jgi:hypothetical protein
VANEKQPNPCLFWRPSLEHEKDPSLPSQKPSSLLRLLGTLASSFVTFFSSFSNPMQHSNNPEHPKDSTNEHADVRINPGSGPIRVVIDSVPPPISPTHEEETEKNKKKRRKTIKFWAELIIGFFVIAYTIVSVCLWQEMRKQNQSILDINERPWVFVKMPEAINIKVGQPITAPIEVFNYNKNSPAMVRAAIHIEVGPNAIETFRDNVLHNASTYLLAPDDRGIKRIFLPPDDGTWDFIPEYHQGTLTQSDYDRIMSGVTTGTLDVAIYGRIFYTSLGDPTKDYQTIFCFYLLRDHSVSACPDKPDAYTNWLH